MRAGYRAREASNWIQPALWVGCPWDDIGMPGGVEGTKLEDNFENFQTCPVNTSNITQEYNTWVDTGGTLLQHTTSPFGAAIGQMDTTSNDGASIQTGNLINFIDPATGTAPYDIWFDCQFELTTITDAFFVGAMAYAAPATAALITDGGVMGGTGDVGFVGFGAAESAPTLLTFTYKKNGQTVQVPISSMATMVAATKVAVGFTYKVNNPTSQKISIFKNNVKNATGVTKANIEAATFPDNVPMALTAAIKNQTTTAGQGITLYRWRMAMVKR
jgi:hypothetical protein